MKQGRGSKEGAVREERKGGKEKKGRTERGRGTTTEMGSHCCSCTQPDSAFSNFISISILN